MESKCLCYLLALFPEKTAAEEKEKKPPPFDLLQFQKAPKPELTSKKTSPFMFAEDNFKPQSKHK